MKNLYKKKLNLWKLFYTPFFKCCLLSVPLPILEKYIFGMTGALFSQEEKIINYTDLIPNGLKYESWSFDKIEFIFLGASLGFFYFLFTYFYEFWIWKLVIKITNYIKTRSLKKFRKLSFEEKVKRKEEVISIIERDSELTSYCWIDFWRNLFRGCLSISLFIFPLFKHKKKISYSILLISLFWIIFTNWIVYLFYRYSLFLEKNLKEKKNNERSFINEEINHSNLINSMGIEEEYQNKQKKITLDCALYETKNKKITSLRSNIPWKLLINLFPFVILIIEANFIGSNAFDIWILLNQSISAFSHFGKLPDYISSRIRIEKLLSLPEKKLNLKGAKISSSKIIKKISFKEVVFKYENQKKNMFFEDIFISNKINFLSTPNGSGKSTKIYLLLGIIFSSKGHIEIETVDNIKYDLVSLNLVHWRKKNVAFFSYQNLIKKKVSTGQKQLINIEQILDQNKNAQIFIFDEADNALDKNKKIWFQEQLMKLVKNKKIVIYVKC